MSSFYGLRLIWTISFIVSHTIIQSKHQKHQAFEAELAANADRLQALLATGQTLIDQKQCAGSEDAVQARLESLASQWETLVAKSAEKSDKLKEANRQQTYNAGVKDMEFWLGEVHRLYSHWSISHFCNSICCEIVDYNYELNFCCRLNKCFPQRSMERTLLLYRTCWRSTNYWRLIFQPMRLVKIVFTNVFTNAQMCSKRKVP